MPLAQAQINPQPTLAVAPLDTSSAWFSAGDVMNVILVLGVLAIAFSFWRAQKDRTNDINFFDLLLEPMDDGKKRLSLLKSMAIGGWAIYSWAIVRWIITGSITTADMQSYAAACLAPILAAVISNAATRRKEKTDG